MLPVDYLQGEEKILILSVSASPSFSLSPPLFPLILAAQFGLPVILL
jgi:hypothetical protein